MIKTILRARKDAIFGPNISLYIGQRFADGRRAFAHPVTFEVLEQDAVVGEYRPSVELSPDEAQAFIDELWNLGIRPTEGHGSTGQLAATEKHLDHTTQLLNQTLQTVLNVANASLIPKMQNDEVRHGAKDADLD
jgi:hypothetical protein